MTDGVLPFKSESGNNIRRHKGYYFLDGRATQVSDLYPTMKEWLKVKAYDVILNGKEESYENIPVKDRDTEIKEMCKLLKSKTFQIMGCK